MLKEYVALMKIIIVISCLFFSLILKSQSFGVVFTSGIWTTKNVEKEMDKEIRKGIKNKVIVQSEKMNSGDTLVYKINHLKDGFTTKYTFGIKENDEAFCDFEQYIFDCATCSQKHLQEFIKLCEFRQKSDFVYISNYTYNTELIVSNKDENKDCLILTFRTSNLSKREFKKTYRNLSKF